MQMKRKLLFIILLLISSTVVINCKGEDTDADNSDGNQITIRNGKTFKFKNKLFSVPSPFHISDLIKDISSEYNSDLLNSTENKINYTSSEKKALNLGVYTADLGYSNVYEHVSATAKYIKVVRSLSSELQIMNAYTSDILDEIEANHQNKDTLYKIFADSYREADLYLSDNDRSDISVLIMTGGWVEGLYLMTQHCIDNKNSLLINRIGEQKYSLENILKLLSQNNSGENSVINELYDNLTDLKKSFEKVKVNYTYDKHIVLPNEKKTIIISNTEIIIDEVIIDEISKKIKNIRSIIIK